MKKNLLVFPFLLLSFVSKAQIPAPFAIQPAGSAPCTGSNDNWNGGNATGLGCGGGGADWYGGNGGNGLYGGGGGGAASYQDGVANSGGNGGDGVIIASFRNSSNGLIRTYLYTSGTSFTAPAGTASVKVFAIGAGGGGAGTDGWDDGHSGGGGGAGGAAYVTFALAAGNVVNYTLGIGGAGGIGNNNGSAGTATTLTFGAISITGEGGQGGEFNTGTEASGGTFSGGDGGENGGNGGGGAGDSHGGAGGGIGATPVNYGTTCGRGNTGTNSSDFGGLFVAASTTLPVRLISFSGSKQMNNTVVNWKTAEEINVSHFEIQRSDDGRNFITIGTIQPGGAIYSYTDINIFNGKSTLFYRLKSVDTDESFAYSSILKLTSQQNAALTVFPNPVQDVVTISGLRQNGIIRLFSADGKLLQQEIITSQSATMNLGNYATGIYMLQYEQQGEVVNQKIIKQ